ncbi:hypothetical protein DET49_107121 [Salegentibacter sp. 24]|nr:hypothetical protein DET49_107121 [Salegentibacter sp. 24]
MQFMEFSTEILRQLTHILILFKELSEIECFPSDKIDGIQLYLALN